MPLRQSVQRKSGTGPQADVVCREPGAGARIFKVGRLVDASFCVPAAEGGICGGRPRNLARRPAREIRIQRSKLADSAQESDAVVRAGAGSSIESLIADAMLNSPTQPTHLWLDAI